MNELKQVPGLRAGHRSLLVDVLRSFHLQGDGVLSTPPMS